MSNQQTAQDRIGKALEIAAECGGIDGGHHKMWVIDQMVRALTGCPMEEKTHVDYRDVPYSYEAMGESEEYRRFVAEYEAGEDGPDTYEWDEGAAP